MTTVNSSLAALLTFTEAVTLSNMTTGHPAEMEAAEEEEDDESLPLTVLIFLGIVTSVIGVINIIGNSLTIAAFVRDKNLRTVHNHYIVNLAVTDLTIGISSVPFYAVYTLLNYTWPFGYAFCKVWLLVDFLVCAESVATVILISIDRYLLISQGVQYGQKQTKRKAVTRIGVSWLLAFLLYSPAIIGFNHWRGHSIVDEMDCDVEFASDVYFTMVTACMEFFLPFLLVCYFNLRVYLSIRRRTRTVVPGTGQGSEQGTLHRDKKAARSLAILVAVYFVCWSPYTVTTMVISFCEHCIDENVYEAFNWLLWLNSSLNPFLYAATSERFRTNFKRLLGLKKCFRNGSRLNAEKSVTKIPATQTSC